MKCVRCGKALTRAAMMTGQYAWGPKCMRIAGLTFDSARLPRRAMRIIERGRGRAADPRQLTLELVQ